MISTPAAMAAVLAALAALMALMRWYQAAYRPHPEVARKLVHVGMGLIALSFPWIFPHGPWPVIALAALAALGMLLVRLVPGLRSGAGSVLHAVERQSAGDLCYPLGVAAVFYLARGDPVLFIVPILILTLADAVAALIGVAYGRVHYQSPDGTKSAEGSISFFTVAFLSAHVPLLLMTDVGRAESLLIGLVLGMLVMIVEAVSWGGLDNLFVPLLSYALLRIFTHLPLQALQERCAALVALLGLVLLWRRRSTLGAPARLGGVLFGYSCYALGGGAWIVAPVLFFLLHAMLWPRPANAPVEHEHDLRDLTTTVAPAVVWLFLRVEGGPGPALLAFNAVFAGHLAIVGLSWLDTVRPRSTQLAKALAWTLAGWLAVFLPAGALAWFLVDRWPVFARHGDLGILASIGVPGSWDASLLWPAAGLAGAAAAAAIYFAFTRLRPPRPGEELAFHWTHRAAVLAGSLLTWLMLTLG